MKIMLLALIGISFFAFGAGAEGWFEEEGLDSFEYNNCDELVVERGGIYSVYVTRGSGFGIEGRIITPRDSRLIVKHEHRGGTVRIWVERRSSWFSWAAGEHRMELEVPRNCRLRIRTDTGAINVERVHGDMRLETDTGTISVAEAEGDIQAQTNTGSIRLGESEGTLRAEVDTGTISVSGFRGRLALHADTGSLAGEEIRLTGDSSFETDTGHIGFQLENPPGELRFELHSDTGWLEAFSSRAQKNLAAGGGAILVRATSDTGAIRFR